MTATSTKETWLAVSINGVVILAATGFVVLSVYRNATLIRENQRTAEQNAVTSLSNSEVLEHMEKRLRNQIIANMFSKPEAEKLQAEVVELDERVDGLESKVGR